MQPSGDFIAIFHSGPCRSNVGLCCPLEIALSTFGTTGAWNQYPDNPWRLDPRPRSEKLAIEARHVKQSYFSLSRQNGRHVMRARSGNHVTVCTS